MIWTSKSFNGTGANLTGVRVCERLALHGRWPAFEEALEANGKTYQMYMYEGANHGFHNDTTPRYDEDAARLAQDRTIAFFNQHLR